MLLECRSGTHKSHSFVTNKLLYNCQFLVHIGGTGRESAGIAGILFGFKHLNRRMENEAVVLALSTETFYWLLLVSRDTRMTNCSAAAPTQILKKRNAVFCFRLSCAVSVDVSSLRLKRKLKRG